MLVISTFLFGKFPTKGGNYRMSAYAYAYAYALVETSLKENIQLHACCYTDHYSKRLAERLSIVRYCFL